MNQIHSFPALFLDRDGVIVEDVPYNGDPSKVVLRPQICEMIRAAKKAGYWIVMISNQSGIGRNKISVNDFFNVHREMCFQLAQHGCFLDHWEIATFIEGCNLNLPWSDPELRKPNDGMIVKATSHLNIDLSKSVLVGDSATDILAGAKAHIKKLFLISDGNLDRFEAEKNKIQKVPYDWEAVTDFSLILSFLSK